MEPFSPDPDHLPFVSRELLDPAISDRKEVPPPIASWNEYDSTIRAMGVDWEEGWNDRIEYAKEMFRLVAGVGADEWEADGWQRARNSIVSPWNKASGPATLILPLCDAWLKEEILPGTLQTISSSANHQPCEVEVAIKGDSMHLGHFGDSALNRKQREMLIASEFMPVSLLTPIAHDLGATDGMAGQAISISGLFAVIISLFIATIAGRFDRRHVLMTLTAVMLASLVLIALAPSFALLMVARALLGIVIGGFWALATATVMRLVPEESVPKALGAIYTGNAVATAFAAPIGSYFGGIIGWRGVFWALVPIVALNLVWQWVSLPSMAPQKANSVGKLLSLLKRRNVAFATLAQMFTFGGAFAAFTYFRPFLESYTHVTLPQLSLLLLGLGVAGFAGTYAATALVRRHLRSLLSGLPLALAAVTLGLLATGHILWGVAITLVAWGTLNSAIPVAWATWLAKDVSDEPESGGGLMVGAIQLSIMLGGALGGLLLDHISIAATMIGGTVLLVIASLTASVGQRTSGAAVSRKNATVGAGLQELASR